LHVLVLVPQLPHAAVAAPAHEHEPHWQLPPQDCVPWSPHACEALGAHAPSSLQADQSLQPALVHVRVCVPQLPQACVVEPGQAWQAPHWQLPPHCCVPASPHACDASGAQTPWLPHDDQALHVPLSHVRVWAPQLPHAWVVGPVHAWPTVFCGGGCDVHGPHGSFAGASVGHAVVTAMVNDSPFVSAVQTPGGSTTRPFASVQPPLPSGMGTQHAVALQIPWLPGASCNATFRLPVLAGAATEQVDVSRGAGVALAKQSSVSKHVAAPASVPASSGV
jgi:hypothetical protein